ESDKPTEPRSLRRAARKRSDTTESTGEARNATDAKLRALSEPPPESESEAKRLLERSGERVTHAELGRALRHVRARLVDEIAVEVLERSIRNYAKEIPPNQDRSMRTRAATWFRAENLEVLLQSGAEEYEPQVPDAGSDEDRWL